MFGNYDFRNWLEGFIPLVYGKEELGLARIEELLKRLGNPQNKFKSIHIAGTSGKGSCAFYISRMLQFAGPVSPKLKVGLHVSPHLSYVGERMQINGEPIPVKKLIGLIGLIKPVVEKIQKEKPELTPSYFEILVAMSFMYFAQEKVDFAVVEVGLGGRLDATNVLHPEVSVITNIGLDHTEILGGTLEKIAYEKAGIVKRATPIIAGAKGKALKIIKDVASKNNARLVSVSGIKYLVPGIPQYCTKETAGLVIQTVETLGFRPTSEQIEKTFRVGFPGRFEEIEPGVILDGAHNPDKIRSLINFIQKLKISSSDKPLAGRQYPKSIILVLGFKSDKKWKNMIDILLGKLTVKGVIATRYNAVTDTGKGSAVEPAEICDYVTKVHGTKCRVVGNSQEAVYQALRQVDGKPAKNLILVTGSLYLVGEVRTVWKIPVI